MNLETWLPHAANLGGVVVIAILLVWRIDVRMAAVERSNRDLAACVKKLLWKLEG